MAWQIDHLLLEPNDSGTVIRSGNSSTDPVFHSTPDVYVDTVVLHPPWEPGPPPTGHELILNLARTGFWHYATAADGIVGFSGVPVRTWDFNGIRDWATAALEFWTPPPPAPGMFLQIDRTTGGVMFSGGLQRAFKYITGATFDYNTFNPTYVSFYALAEAAMTHSWNAAARRTVGTPSQDWFTFGDFGALLESFGANSNFTTHPIAFQSDALSSASVWMGPQAAVSQSSFHGAEANMGVDLSVLWTSYAYQYVPAVLDGAQLDRGVRMDPIAEPRGSRMLART